MMSYDTALARIPLIMAGVAVLVAGCDRTDQAQSKAPARAATAQAVSESPTAAGSTVQQQPADSQNNPPGRDTSAEEAAEPVSSPGKEPVTRESDASDAKIIVYYFHRTMRCPTCLSIEQQAREVVEIAYEEELAAGKLEWHAVNIEEEGNGHFEDDFALSSSALVLVEMQGNEVTKWKDLERVWALVDDPFGFQKYVGHELMEFLPES